MIERLRVNLRQSLSKENRPLMWRRLSNAVIYVLAVFLTYAVLEAVVIGLVPQASSYVMYSVAKFNPAMRLDEALYFWMAPVMVTAAFIAVGTFYSIRFCWKQLRKFTSRPLKIKDIKTR